MATTRKPHTKGAATKQPAKVKSKERARIPYLTFRQGPHPPVDTRDWDAAVAKYGFDIGPPEPRPKRSVEEVREFEAFIEANSWGAVILAWRGGNPEPLIDLITNGAPRPSERWAPALADALRASCKKVGKGRPMNLVYDQTELQVIRIFLYELALTQSASARSLKGDPTPRDNAVRRTWERARDELGFEGARSTVKTIVSGIGD